MVNNKSVIALIAANFIPIFGVLFFGWDLFTLLILYWAESAVIGFYTIFKLIIVGKYLAILLVPFFIIHFGAFMVGHLLAIMALLNVQINIFKFEEFYPIFFKISYAFMGLVISHGISFFVNFIGEEKFKILEKGKALGMIEWQPYKRVLLMHFVIILSGFLIVFFRINTTPLILLVGLKTIVDLKSHRKQYMLKYP